MNTLVIDSGPLLDRVASLKDKKLHDLFIEEKSDKHVVGNIYKGRVVNVLPAMDAAFVDIGLKKNGYLYIKDAIPFDEKRENQKNKRIQDYVKSGQEIFVQVFKPEVEDKGPKLTTNLSITGRYLVLTPMDSFVGISKKITDIEIRKRFKKIIKDKIPKGMGCVVRTEAGKVDIDLVLKDLTFVLELWRRINREKHLGKTPRLINRDISLPSRVLRDSKESYWDKIIVNKKELFDELELYVKCFMPGQEKELVLKDHGPLLFENEGVEKQIDQLIFQEVVLEHGVSILIEETRALTSIDVNSGKFVGESNLEDTFLKTNLLAAKEIMRQIRLRNLSGIIIIDFIDMKNDKNRKIVLELLMELSKEDKVQIDFYGFTKLGLMELSRKKTDNSIFTKLYNDCRVCKGLGKTQSELEVANLFLKEIERISIHTDSEAAVFLIDSMTYKFLQEKSIIRISDIEKEYNLSVTFKIDNESDKSYYKLKFMGRKSDVGKFTKNK